MHFARTGALAALASLLFAPVDATAQLPGPMKLDARGGSIPGTLSLDLGPAGYFNVGVILMGVDPGPIPMWAIDPADTRMLSVGPVQLSVFFGFFGLDQRFALPTWTVPNDPAFVDVALYFQGLSYGGLTTVWDEISPPEAIRFAPGGAFRDRQVYMVDDRAFGTILPRGDGRWMIAGGGRGALLAQVAVQTTEIYDDVTDSFQWGPNMNAYRSVHTATELQDGRWLLVGGVNLTNDPQDLCEIYDPVADTFTLVAPLATGRAGHTATLLNDGRVLVTGGLGTVTGGIDTIDYTLASTEIYNPATNTWSAGPNLRTPRVGHMAILRPNGTVLLAGGVSYDDFIFFKLPAIRSTTDLFNPATNAITAGPGMATARSLVDAVPVGNDRYLLAGGISTISLTNLGTPTGNAEIYDANANSWSAAGSMAAPRANQRAITLDANRILMVGGADGAIMTPNPLSSGEIYDIGANSWGPGPSLNLARAGAASYVTPHGQVHIIGGGTTTGAIARVCEWWYF